MDSEKNIAVICTEIGRGSKASIYVCSPEGYDGKIDYILTAYKDAPYTYRYTYRIVSDKPKGITLTIKARNRREIRRFLEQYIANLIMQTQA